MNEAMETANQLIPHIATHPGEMLKDELEARVLSQADFAKLVGLKRSQLNEIIKGKRSINADLAILLESALGIDADFWMEAQKNYDLDTARIRIRKDERIKAIKEIAIAKEYTAYKFLKKEKVISGDPLDDVKILKDIYETADFSHLAMLQKESVISRFRKSTKLKMDPINILGWDKLVKYRAREVRVENFDANAKQELLDSLKKVLYDNEGTKEKVKELLAAHGIKLIYQAKGEKTPVDGVSFWSGDNPAIGMSLRHKRVDNFAFTLFHELGHIYEHIVADKNKEFIDLDPRQEKETYKNSKEEQEANRFAEVSLISDQEWDEYVRRYGSNSLRDDNILSFSREIRIHPGILRGRICHKLGFYKARTTIDNKLH